MMKQAEENEKQLNNKIFFSSLRKVQLTNPSSSLDSRMPLTSQRRTVTPSQVPSHSSTSDFRQSQINPSSKNTIFMQRNTERGQPAVDRLIQGRRDKHSLNNQERKVLSLDKQILLTESDKQGYQGTQYKSMMINPQIALVHQNSNQYLNANKNQNNVLSKTLNNSLFHIGKGDQNSINGIENGNNVYMRGGIQNKNKTLVSEHLEITPQILSHHETQLSAIQLLKSKEVNRRIKSMSSFKVSSPLKLRNQEILQQPTSNITGMNLPQSAKRRRPNMSEIFQSMNNLDSYQSINDTYSQNFKWIDKIESKNFTKSSDLNGQDQLKRTSIKKSIQQTNILSSNKSIDSQHAYPGTLTILRCQINDFIYFKVRVFDLDSPLRLKFSTDITGLNMRLFVSSSCLQPNNFNCDSIFTNCKTVVLEEERGQSRFKKLHLFYFSLVTDKSQDIFLRIAFGKEKREQDPVQQTNGLQIFHQNHIASNKKPAQSTPVLMNFEDEDEEKDKDKRQEEQGDDEKDIDPPPNMILKNIEASGQITQFSRSLSVINRRQGNLDKMLLVLEKASKLKSAKVEEILKLEEDRIQRQIQKILTFRREFFVFFWGQIIKAALLAKCINGRFVEKKQIILNFSKIAWRAPALALKFRVKQNNFNFKPQQIDFEIIHGLIIFVKNKIFYSKYPSDLIKNNLRYGRLAMETFANMIKKHKKQQCGQILIQALKYNQYYSDMKSKMMWYYSKALLISVRYKQFRQRKNNYKKLLQMLWNKYYFMVVESIIEVSKSSETDQQFWKKKQQLIKQLNSHIGKTYAINCYFMEQLKKYKEQDRNYLIHISSLSQGQRIKVEVTEAFMNSHVKKKSKQMLDNISLDEIKDFNVDSIILMQTTPVAAKKERIFMAKPKLFVLPSFKAMENIIYQGVAQFIHLSPDIQDKVQIKQKP